MYMRPCVELMIQVTYFACLGIDMAHGDLAVLLPPSSAQLLIHAGVGGLMLPSHSLTHAAAVPGIANNESMCLRCCCFIDDRFADPMCFLYAGAQCGVTLPLR